MPEQRRGYFSAEDLALSADGYRTFTLLLSVLSGEAEVVLMATNNGSYCRDGLNPAAFSRRITVLLLEFACERNVPSVKLRLLLQKRFTGVI